MMDDIGVSSRARRDKREANILAHLAAISDAHESLNQSVHSRLYR